jgi:hypothetical protein
MLLSLSLITKIIYDIIKKKSRKLSVFLSILTLILVGICVWYFIPTRYHLPDINDLNIKVSYPANHADCYDLQNSLILNPQDLINYFKTLL